MADGLCVEGEGYETRFVLEKMAEEERLAQVCVVCVVCVMCVLCVIFMCARVVPKALGLRHCRGRV